MPHPARAAASDLLEAAGPHRVISTDRLRALGVPSPTISRRCRPGGPWTLVLHRTVLLATGTPTARQRLVAALEYGGPESVITGFAAARAHGLRRGPDDGAIAIAVPHRRGVVSHSFVSVERTHRLPRYQTLDGVRVAAAARAVVDGVRRLTEVDDVRAVLAEAVQRGRTTPQLLGEELDAGPSAGSALPRAVLLEVRDGIRSAAEGWARDLVRASTMPAPVWNPALHGAQGFLARPDAYWPELGVAWQIDSREWHLDPASWERTLWRRTLLESAGVVVVSTVPQWLRRHRRVVLAELEAAHGRATHLPAPDVRLVALAP